MKGILDSTFIWLENHKRQISHQNISCSRWFSVDWSRCAMSMYRGRTTRAQQRLTLTSVWMNEWSDEWSDEIDGPWSVAMRKCASAQVKMSSSVAWPSPAVLFYTDTSDFCHRPVPTALTPQRSAAVRSSARVNLLYMDFFKGIFTNNFGSASRTHTGNRLIPTSLKEIPRLRPRRRQGRQYAFAVVLGIAISCYTFQPLFKEFAEEQESRRA